MEVPNSTLTLTKAEAATRQVEAAIEALLQGRFDVAVTLAGAAEGMIEKEGLTLYNLLMGNPKIQHLPRKLVNSHLNQVRDWLKHTSGPPTMNVRRADAAEMIARAATKLDSSCWTQPIEAFKGWYIANLEEIYS